MTVAFKRGHRFEGPDGQGYELTQDVQIGEEYECMRSDQFAAFGGAPEPKPWVMVPEWLLKQIDEQAEQMRREAVGKRVNG